MNKKDEKILNDFDTVMEFLEKRNWKQAVNTDTLRDDDGIITAVCMDSALDRVLGTIPRESVNNLRKALELACGEKISVLPIVYRNDFSRWSFERFRTALVDYLEGK